MIMTKDNDVPSKTKTKASGQRRGKRPARAGGREGRRGSGERRPLQAGGSGVNLEPRLKAIVHETLDRSVFIVFDIDFNLESSVKNLSVMSNWFCIS
jgi:hypothetical protein